jgi:hypothetical protein
MDIGRDNGLVVDLDYEDRAPYAFTGTVKKVVFDLKPRDPRRRESAARARPDTRDRPGRGRLTRAGDSCPARPGAMTMTAAFAAARLPEESAAWR